MMVQERQRQQPAAVPPARLCPEPTSNGEEEEEPPIPPVPMMTSPPQRSASAGSTAGSGGDGRGSKKEKDAGTSTTTPGKQRKKRAPGTGGSGTGAAGAASSAGAASDGQQRQLKLQDQLPSKNAVRSVRAAAEAAKEFDAEFRGLLLRGNGGGGSRESSIPLFDGAEIVLESATPSRFFGGNGAIAEYDLKGIGLTVDDRRRDGRHFGSGSDDDPGRRKRKHGPAGEESRRRCADRVLQNPGHYSARYLRRGVVDMAGEGPAAARSMILEAKVLMNLRPPHPNVLQIYGVNRNGVDAFLDKGATRASFFLVTDRLVETLAERIGSWRQGQSYFSSSSSCLGDGDDDDDDGEKDSEDSMQRMRRIRRERRHHLMERLEVANDVCTALVFLHDRELVMHLNPSKVGFDAKCNRVKLCDFGQARHHGSAALPLLSASQNPFSATDLPYVAPEILSSFSTAAATTAAATPTSDGAAAEDGAPPASPPAASNAANAAVASASSDVYAFGVMLWEVLSLRRPYEEVVAAATAAAAAATASCADDDESSPPTLLERFRQAVVPGVGNRPDITADDEKLWPKVVRDVVVRCWDPVPENRPTIKQVNETLETALLFHEDDDEPPPSSSRAPTTAAVSDHREQQDDSAEPEQPKKEEAADEAGGPVPASTTANAASGSLHKVEKKEPRRAREEKERPDSQHQHQPKPSSRLTMMKSPSNRVERTSSGGGVGVGVGGNRRAIRKSISADSADLAALRAAAAAGKFRTAGGGRIGRDGWGRSASPTPRTPQQQQQQQQQQRQRDRSNSKGRSSSKGRSNSKGRSSSKGRSNSKGRRRRNSFDGVERHPHGERPRGTPKRSADRTAGAEAFMNPEASHRSQRSPKRIVGRSVSAEQDMMLRRSSVSRKKLMLHATSPSPSGESTPPRSHAKRCIKVSRSKSLNEGGIRGMSSSDAALLREALMNLPPAPAPASEAVQSTTAREKSAPDAAADADAPSTPRRRPRSSSKSRSPTGRSQRTMGSTKSGGSSKSSGSSNGNSNETSSISAAGQPKSGPPKREAPSRRRCHSFRTSSSSRSSLISTESSVSVGGSSSDDADGAIFMSPVRRIRSDGINSKNCRGRGFSPGPPTSGGRASGGGGGGGGGLDPHTRKLRNRAMRRNSDLGPNAAALLTPATEMLSPATEIFSLDNVIPSPSPKSGSSRNESLSPTSKKPTRPSKKSLPKTPAMLNDADTGGGKVGKAGGWETSPFTIIEAKSPRFTEVRSSRSKSMKIASSERGVNSNDQHHRHRRHPSGKVKRHLSSDDCSSDRTLRRVERTGSGGFAFQAALSPSGTSTTTPGSHSSSGGSGTNSSPASPHRTRIRVKLKKGSATTR